MRRPRIALEVNTELGDYLLAELRRCWPEARVSRWTGTERVAADLRVVDRPPDSPPAGATLWLAGISRRQALVQIVPGLWCAGMPTTARRLRQIIEFCLSTTHDPDTGTRHVHPRPDAPESP